MSEIDIKLSAIYHAAHEELPAAAGVFGRQAGAITAAIEPALEQLALAGNHAIGDDMLTLADELFHHLRRVARTCNESALALDRIADDFVELEGEVAEHWRGQHRQYLGEPDLPTLPSAPEPSPMLSPRALGH